MFPKIGFSLKNKKKPRTTHLKDFVTYIFMENTSQGLNKPHFRLPCQIPGVSIGRGSWVVGRGSQVVGRGFQVVGRGSQVVGRGFQVVGCGLLIGRYLH